jgi:hypothetical protein
MRNQTTTIELHASQLIRVKGGWSLWGAIRAAWSWAKRHILAIVQGIGGILGYKGTF